MRGGRSEQWKSNITKAYVDVVNAIRKLRQGQDRLAMSRTDFSEAVSNFATIDKHRNNIAVSIDDMYKDLQDNLPQDEQRLNMVARSLAKAYPEKLKAAFNKSSPPEKPGDPVASLGGQHLLRGPRIA